MSYTVKDVVKALNFPVILKPNTVTNNAGQVVRGIGQQVYRTDGKDKSIANVSDTYGLVQHGDALMPALQALDGLDFKVQALKADHDGRRVMVKMISERGWVIGKLPNGQRNLDHGGGIIPDRNIALEDDEVRLTLMLVNSYDRTDALKVMVGAYRMICSNGLVVSHPAFANLNINIKVIHSQNNVKAAGADIANIGNKVAMLYGAMEQQMEAWKLMKQTHINKKALEALKEKVLEPIIGKRAVEVVAEKAISGKGQDGTLSAWSLYQGLTEVLTEKSEKSKTPVAAEGRRMAKTLDFLSALQTWQTENPEQLVMVNA